MAQLLNEYERAFPNRPEIGTRVQITDSRGKVIPTPEWIRNYRHPDREQIRKLQQQG